MGLTAQKNRNVAILTQQRMRWVDGAFTTIGTSANVDTSDFKVITGAFPVYIGTPAAADGPISVNETFTNGKFVLNTANTMRIARPAGTTSGLQFMVLIFGW